MILKTNSLNDKSNIRTRLREGVTISEICDDSEWDDIVQLLHQFWLRRINVTNIDVVAGTREDVNSRVTYIGSGYCFSISNSISKERCVYSVLLTYEFKLHTSSIKQIMLSGVAIKQIMLSGVDLKLSVSSKRYVPRNFKLWSLSWWFTHVYHN